MSYFIAIEGIDGSGKGTQTAALHRYFQDTGLRTDSITFPRYEETSIGQQIGRFLDGQFGELKHLHPVPISLMYAAERFESRERILEKLRESDLLIADRYVGSNFAHQGARLQGEERSRFLQWIQHVEYEIFAVPRPDLVLVLDLPAEKSAERVAMKQARDYTAQVTDLYESDHAYLASVRDVYLELCQQFENWQLVSCFHADGQPRDVTEVQCELQGIIQTRLS